LPLHDNCGEFPISSFFRSVRVPTITEDLNFVPVKLRFLFEETELAIGTGFFYRFQDSSTHLVTNWHNVTGRHPETNELLHSKGGIPDKIVIGIPRTVEQGPPKKLAWDWKNIWLHDDGEKQCPAWNEHPTFGRRVDVVTISISELEVTAIIPANDPTLKLDRLRLYPSLDVFVLGFPKGMSGGAHFPIWKRGSIATEPDIDIDGLPKLFIDTATREGMSGAPVYAQEAGYWMPEGSEQSKDAVFGKGRRFLGIYSGRVGDDSFQAQLGIVWKPSAIEDIIRHSLSKKQAEKT
jgi:hypothetical protein